MELAGPWVPDQGLNLGPRRQRADAPSANRWTAFPEKRRMLSGNVLRPLLPPQSPKARAGDARQRCSSGPEQRHLDNNLQVHPCCYKGDYFIILYG